MSTVRQNFFNDEICCCVACNTQIYLVHLIPMMCRFADEDGRCRLGHVELEEAIEKETRRVQELVGDQSLRRGASLLLLLKLRLKYYPPHTALCNKTQDRPCPNTRHSKDEVQQHGLLSITESGRNNDFYLYMYDECFCRAASDAPVSFDRFSKCVESLPKRSLLLPTLVHMQVWQDSRSKTSSRKKTIKVPVSPTRAQKEL